MVLGFTDKLKYNRQLATVRMWVAMRYVEKVLFGLMHCEHVD